MRIPLYGGAFVTRSPLGNNQRCINIFPEKNRKDGPQTFTHYQRPGLRQLAQGPNTTVRGLYRPSNGVGGYTVIGQNVYFINQNFNLVLLGQLNVPGTNQVSFIDNGIQILLVDGSAFGYTINLSNNAFAQVVDHTGAFNGANKVDYIDTFTLWNLPDTQQFGSTLSNELVFDALNIAAKTDYPDLLQTLIVNRHELLLFGTLKSEIWYDAGNANFPFAELPGAYIEWGALAKYSVAAEDISVFWLAQGLQGVGLVLRQQGYQTKPISNHALSYAIRQMAANGADLTDAIAYTYTQDGHIFYVLTFVSGDQTWVFDDSINDPELAWHQRGWADANGILHRERANCHAFINNVNVVGDWQNGALYAMDLNHYTDDVAGVAGPIACTRTLPLLMEAAIEQGQLQQALADGRLIQIHKFTADVETGMAPLNLNAEPPSISLRWSFDRGRTWGQAIMQSVGETGKYFVEPRWAPLGLGRFPLLELSYSIPGPCSLNGGWIDATISKK